MRLEQLEDTIQWKKEANKMVNSQLIPREITELLKLKGNEKVLEIGTGSGYQAAVLAHLLNSLPVAISQGKLILSGVFLK